MSSGADDRESAIAREALADQRVGTSACDPDTDDVADSFPPAFGEVHDTVVFASPLPVVWIAATVAVNQDRNFETDEFLVEL
jgi:hypothetical protein